MANIEELAKVEPPKIPKSGSLGFQEALGIQQPYMQRKAEIQTGIASAREEEALAKQRQQEGLAEAKAGVQETRAGAEKAARAGYEEKLAEEPLPEFIPTKDTVQDIAGLFGLIGVIGMIAGKGDAMKAMSAMNGMLAGHREGRLELYRQERDTFDKNFRAMLKKHEEFRKEMEDAIKTAATNAEAGMAKAELAATKAGSEIVKAQLRKGDLMGAYKLVEESGKGAQNALATEAKMREAAASRAAAMQRTQMQIAAADRRASEKEKKTPTDIEKSVRQNATFLDSMTDIVEQADKLIKKGDIRGIGVIQGKIPYDVAQLYMTKEERDFLQNFNALTNQKLKDQSGATVTGAEFARQRGVLPLRDDNLNVISDKLKNWKRLVAQETAVIGRVYPQIIRKYGIALDLPQRKDQLVPGLEYNTKEGVMLWDGENFLAPSGE